MHGSIRSASSNGGLRRFPLAGVLFSLAMPAMAQQPAIDVFAEAWRGGNGWEPRPGWVYAWRREIMPTSVEEEVDREQARLRPTPDHPESAELEAEAARVARGPDIAEHQVWWLGPGEFRWNSTKLTPGTPEDQVFTDIVVCDDAVFCLNARQLTILQPGAPELPGRNFSSFEASTLMTLSKFLGGGLGSLEYSGFKPIDARWEGDALVGVAENDAGARVECRLIGAAPAEGWRPVEIRWLSADPAGVTALRYQFDGWTIDESLRSPRAARIQRYDEQGRLAERLEWLPPRPIEPGEFARVTAIPAHDGHDSVRGASRFATIMDFRPSVQRMTHFAADGPVQEPISANLLPPQSARRWSVIAWPLAAILVAALVGFRLWRSQRGPTN